MLLLMAYQLCFLPRLTGEAGLKADGVSNVGEEMGKADAIIVPSSIKTEFVFNHSKYYS
jgi:hypothetical protein